MFGVGNQGLGEGLRDMLYPRRDVFSNGYQWERGQVWSLLRFNQDGPRYAWRFVGPSSR